jgi:hypothetical protein
MTRKWTYLMPGETIHSQHRIGMSRCRGRGFALVVTLSLMILLTVLAVGLLSLSSIALRGSSQADAVAAARANARMALTLALGDLQRQTGPDTRITARADILDEKNPPVLGVWQSWQGADHETTGTFKARPVSPGNYAAEKKKRFVAWLTSSNTTDPATLPDTVPATGKATLVGTGTLGTDTARAKLQVHLTPTLVTTANQQGGIAWWIGGENQKARLPRPYRPDPATSAARWAVQAKSYPVADPQPFRMEPVLADHASADMAITLRQADLIASASATATADTTSREFFHDLSAVSVGLLTNTANGGWRKDLSLLTESWATQPQSGLPLFRLTPESDVLFTRPTTDNPVPVGSMFYPWAAYRNTTNSSVIYQVGPVTSWGNLADYATLYKKMTALSSGRLSIPTNASYVFAKREETYKYLHEVRILPLIARMQWVFSHLASSSAAPNQPALPAGKLEPRLLATPAITMWNPYNVEIKSPPLHFAITLPLPVALCYSINGASNQKYNSLMVGSKNSPPYAPLGGVSLEYKIEDEFTLNPGETRLFSPADSTPVPSVRAFMPGREGVDSVPIVLKPGYRSGGGDYFPILDNNNKTLALDPGSTIQAAVKFDTQMDDYGNGVGIKLDMYTHDLAVATWVLAYRMVYAPQLASATYSPLENLAASSLQECLGNPMPFFSSVFGARMASRTHLAAKGFVQSSPFVNYTAMGKDQSYPFTHHYAGTVHPVNSPFDYSFIKHPSANDSLLPNVNDTSDRGYIVTGFNSSDGLSRCVIDELPTRPLVSLGELTNWDLRYENPLPPYAFNLIGNSDASPLLPADTVVNAAEKPLPDNLQYDDSYCANHLLFDDWFVSSITPDPADFGSAGGRSLQETYTDFVKGTKPLGNRVYQPILDDQAFAAINAAKLYTDHVAKTDSWKTIASRLEVEGMFNVNSTSVAAWRALLGHCRKQRIPYLREAGTSWDTALSAETDYAFSRFSVAGDTEAGKPGSSGDFPDATEFTGYRLLDDKVLDSLATEVVNQVRLRGPFLSLAEFVNRQLSSGNLALAGTLQSALNEVAKSQSNNPFKAIESLSTPTSATPPSVAGYTPEYQFATAAAGYSTYGLPGWTRQADILRPLAPILSVRDDTFTIRAYGDARDAKGNVLARAVCVAVVRRTRDFLDPTDVPDILTPPTQDTNKTYGRRFQLVSFRWLAADEV